MNIKEKDINKINNEILKSIVDNSETVDKLKMNDHIIDTMIAKAKQHNFIKDAKMEEEMRREFKQYSESVDKVSESIDSFKEEYTKLMSEQGDELEKLLKDFNLTEIKQRILTLKEGHLKLGNKIKAKQCEELLSELSNSIELTNIKEGLKSIKQISKVKEIYKDNYDKAYKSYTNKLKNNKVYMFIEPTKNLELTTKLLGNEDDAKLFLFHFYKFLSSTNKINKHAVFINEFTKNLLRTENETFVEKDSLKKHIEEIIVILKNA